MRNAEHFCRRLVDLKITSVDCRLSGFVEESDNDRHPLSKSSIKPLILLITMLMLMFMLMLMEMMLILLITMLMLMEMMLILMILMMILILLITMLMLMEMMLTSHRTENTRLHFSNPGGRWAGWGACA